MSARFDPNALLESLRQRPRRVRPDEQGDAVIPAADLERALRGNAATSIPSSQNGWAALSRGQPGGFPASENNREVLARTLPPRAREEAGAIPLPILSRRPDVLNPALIENALRGGQGNQESAIPTLLPRPRVQEDLSGAAGNAPLLRRRPQEETPVDNSSGAMRPRRVADNLVRNVPTDEPASGSRELPRALLPREPVLNGLEGVNAPSSALPSRPPRVEDIGRPPEFGFDLKGKPVRAWRGDDLSTDIQYRRNLENYKPKDRNGRLKSILYGIAWGISKGAQGGNPWAALGAGLTGGLIGGFHPQFDEKLSREYEMAATDARIDKGFKRRKDELDYQRGVAGYQKTLAEIQKIEDEPERQRRESQLKATSEMRRILAGFYNDLDEFDPATDRDLAAAMREVGLPAVAKRGARQHKVVQDEKTGAWSVVITNKRTGESVGHPVKTENDAQLVTTPRSVMTAEQREADRESRERTAASAEAGRNRRAADKKAGGGSGLTPARRSSLQLQAEKLEAQANSEDKRGRTISAQKYRDQANAVRRQLEGGNSSRPRSGQQQKFTADEVRVRAKRNGNDPEEAVKAARAAGLLSN